MQEITLNGKDYVRHTEMLGDVEKITWFERQGEHEQEIYDQEIMVKLEEAFENSVLESLIPSLPII